MESPPPTEPLSGSIDTQLGSSQSPVGGSPPPNSTLQKSSPSSPVARDSIRVMASPDCTPKKTGEDGPLLVTVVEPSSPEAPKSVSVKTVPGLLLWKSKPTAETAGANSRSP